MKLGLHLLVTILAVSMSFACRSGETRPPTSARLVPTYYEKCASCGMQWSVSILDTSAERSVVEVAIENSGERGDLLLTFDQVVGFAMDAKQADAWRRLYPEARKTGTLIPRLSDTPYTALYLRPVNPKQLTVTVKVGKSWTGQFETIDHGIPVGSAGVILAFGPVEYEQASGSQPKTEHWLTWDGNRPFIGLDGEVRVTPAVVGGTR